MSTKPIYVIVWLLLLVISGTALPGVPINSIRAERAAVERTDLRTANAKVFQYPDGSGYITVSATRQHFQDATGAWQEVDTQLVHNADQPARWHNRADAVAVTFADEPTALNTTGALAGASLPPLLNVAQNELRIALTPLDTAPTTGSVSGATISYPEIYPGVDMHYLVLPDLVKEELILRTLPTQQSFTFLLNVQGGTATLTGNGGLTITPCTQTCFSILPPYLEDANGITSEAVVVELEPQGNDRYLLSYKPDRAWLADPQRAYPVTLDPSVSTGAGHGLFVQEGYPDTSSCNAQRLLAVGFDPVYANKGRTRSFLRFDLPALPSGSRVTAATLRAYQYYATGAGYTSQIRRATTDWAGNCLGTTWNNPPGIDGNALYATRNPDTSTGWKEWSIGELVQQWYNNTPNYGLAILAADENARGSVFCSNVAAGNQCGVTNAQDYRPALVIEFSTNIAPNPPILRSPASGTTVTTQTVVMNWQDGGDPDNGPRASRDYYVEIRKADNSWRSSSGWQTGTSWSITVPGNGSYLWRMQAGDSAAVSSWTTERGFTVQVQAVHSDTKLRGAVENGKTTIWLQVCGKGQNYRFRSFAVNTSTVLWDNVYGSIDGCSPEYRAVINAEPGAIFRFTSAVMNGTLSDADFLQRRRDTCRVVAAGIIECKQGDEPPPQKPADPIPAPPPPALTPCEVPFFSQVDPAWKGHPLRTGNHGYTCSAYCGTIGNCGCTLTSVTMIFRFYGVDTNPAKLSDCMDIYACGFFWGVAPGCSAGKVARQGVYDFSWQLLDQQVNQLKRPVVVGMSKGNNTHYIVVVSGSGSDPNNYIINDPGVLQGAKMSLSAYANRGWNLGQIAVYTGQRPGSCAAANSAASSEAAENASTEGLGESFVEAAGPPDPPAAPAQTATFSGSAQVLRMDATSVTLQFSAQSSAGKITEMVVSSDTKANTTWQPFTPYVIIPAKDVASVRFKDAAGNLSPVYQAFSVPNQQTIGTGVFTVFLPLVRR